MTDTSRAQTAREPSHSSIFIWLFAIASIWHYTSAGGEILKYWSNFHPVITPVILAAIVGGLVAALFPNRTPAVLVFAGTQTLAISIRFPFVPDHLVMELLLNLAILLSYAYLAIRQRRLDIRPDEMFELYSPVGRWLLIVMYFFGTFHKLNPGFMSLTSSCALPFSAGFPLIPEAITSHPLSQYAAIYGTLIFEAIAMLLLLSTRTKYYGMLLGMTFHLMIGISNYGTLAHFSAFALALHTLFLPSTIGDQVREHRFVPGFLKHESGVRAGTAVMVLLQVLAAVHLMLTYKGYVVNSLFAIFGLTLMAIVFRYGRVRASDAPYRLKSALLPLNLIPVLFFVHCTSPYIGLGTGGALAMFSGLRTEGGISNHYIVRKPIPLFSYQDTVIHFESATNPALKKAVAESQGMVMFDFQRHFSSRASLMLPLVVSVDGKRYELSSPDAVVEFAQQYFTEQSWLERKYLSFRLVDSPRPDSCRH